MRPLASCRNRWAPEASDAAFPPPANSAAPQWRAPDAREERGGQPSCDTAFRRDGVEMLENIDRRHDARAQLAKMNLDSRPFAAPGDFSQAPRIALGKRARFDEALKCDIAGSRNCFARSAC